MPRNAIFVLGVCLVALLFAGCGGGDNKDAKVPTPLAKVEPPAKAEMKEAWLHVEGMAKRLEIV